MSYQKLKPCPFCGGKPRFGMKMQPDNNYKFMIWITCTECKSCTGMSLVRAEVVRAWNRRLGEEVRK